MLKISNNKEQLSALLLLLMFYLGMAFTWAVNSDYAWDDDAPTRIYNCVDAFNNPAHFVSLWSSTYILQQGTARTKCKIKSINKSIDLLNLEWKAGGVLESNSISEIELQVATPLQLDNYSSSNKLGAFILIHPQSMLTLAVGFPKN